MTDKKRVCYYLPKALIEKIKKKAAKRGVSRSDIVAELAQKMK